MTLVRYSKLRVRNAPAMANASPSARPTPNSRNGTRLPEVNALMRFAVLAFRKMQDSRQNLLRVEGVRTGQHIPQAFEKTHGFVGHQQGDGELG